MSNYFDDLIPDQTARSTTTSPQRESVLPFMLRRLAPLAPWNPIAQEIGHRIESAGASLGTQAGNFFDDVIPLPQPSVRGRLVTRPSDAALTLHSIPGAIAETIPTEVSKFLTPNSILTNLLLGAGAKGLANTRLGQFPLETIPGLGFLKRFGAPQLFEPITRPKPASPFDVGIQEAELVEPPRALPSPETVGRNLFDDLIPTPPKTPILLPQAKLLPARRMLRVEPQGSPEMMPLIRAREEAIRAVTTELRGQSVSLNQERLNLQKRVRESGGIKPTLAGGLREELQAIRPFLRLGGRAIDDLATELGFENGEALRQALISTRGIKAPTLLQLRQQATQIVDSEPGGRILEAIQTKGATSKAITSVVKDVTSQTQTEISQGLQMVRGLLRTAQQKALTPTQIGRFAKEQRVMPGETQVGSRGGISPAPLSPQDIQQVEQRIPGIVPRPGQPTGAPPKIPTSRAIAPYYPPGTFRDLTEFQAAPLSGLEPYRAFRMIDRHQRGAATTAIYEPVLAVKRQQADEAQIILERFTRLAPNIRAKTPEDMALMALGEGKTPAKGVTPRLLRAAGEMRETYNALLPRVNAVRVRDGKVPILARENYMPHLRAQTLLAEVFGGLDRIPDDAVNVTMGTIHPNSPYVWFQNRREGGAYAKSALNAYQAYVSKALEAIHYSEVLQAVRPHIAALPPRARGYATAYVDKVLARRPHPVDLIPPRTLLKFIDAQRTRTSQGAVSGNVLSFMNQILTMPATVSSTGPITTTRAILSLSKNALSRFVNDLSGKVGIQTAAEAMLRSQQPDVLSFIEQHSPLIKHRTYDIEFNVQPITGGRLNPFAAIANAQNAFDVAMVRLAWYANYLKAARAGVSQTEAIRAAEAGATATNGNFEEAALAPIYRSRVAKSVTQFTVSINTVLNYLRFDAGLQPSRLLQRVPIVAVRAAGTRVNPNPPLDTQAVRRLLYFIGTAAALNALIDAFHVPAKKTGASDILPGVGIFSGQVPATYALPMAIGQRVMAKEPLEIAKADGALWRAAWLQVRYGNQLRKSIEGIMAVAQGAKKSRSGKTTNFPIQGPAEATRAITFGPYGTVAGQAYIQRGFKPLPLTPPQKRLQQRRAASRR